MKKKDTIRDIVDYIVDVEIVDNIEEKPSPKQITQWKYLIENLINDERARAADLVLEWAGSDERWVAERIRRDE